MRHPSHTHVKLVGSKVGLRQGQPKTQVQGGAVEPNGVILSAHVHMAWRVPVMRKDTWQNISSVRVLERSILEYRDNIMAK